MIIQRKQYGAVSVLLVQIGLALYVIVVFLAQGTDGSISPKILKVQKVAEAKQAKIGHFTEKALLGSGSSGQNQIVQTSPISPEQIIALLEAPKADLVLPIVELENFAKEDAEVGDSLHNIYSIGSKPRAPTIG